MNVLDVLQDALGPDCVHEGAATELDGTWLTACFAPADAEALARGLSLIGKAAASVVVRGGGTRLALGNLPIDPALVLSTKRLAGVDTFDPDDGVVHAGAGTSIAEIQQTVRVGGGADDAGWELPMESASPHATLGGLIATAAVGPRVTAFGPPRDVVLGLEVALATGERTHCGGRVVKNVTGYDLGKLYTGSFGSLGVIEAAWLRLRPRPKCVSWWAAPIGDDDAADVLALAAARLSSTRAAIVANRSAARCLDLPVSPEGGRCLWLELAGAPAATERDAAWLTGELAAESSVDVSAEVHGFVEEPLGSRGIRARLAVRSTAVGRVSRALDLAGFGVVSHPGAGLIYANRVADSGGDMDSAELADAIVGVESVAAGEPGAALRFESLPTVAKRDRDVFVVDPVSAELSRDLKHRFDPKGVLNRGRAPGGV